MKLFFYNRYTRPPRTLTLERTKGGGGSGGGVFSIFFLDDQTSAPDIFSCFLYFTEFRDTAPLIGALIQIIFVIVVVETGFNPRTYTQSYHTAACRLFSRGVIFTLARVLLALLSLRKNGRLPVV